MYSHESNSWEENSPCVLEMWTKVLEKLAEITGPWESDALLWTEFSPTAVSSLGLGAENVEDCIDPSLRCFTSG